MSQIKINEYKQAFFNKRSSGYYREEDELKLQAMRNDIGYVEFKVGPTRYKILNIIENHGRFAKNLVKAEKVCKEIAKGVCFNRRDFEREYKKQTLMNATSAERSLIMGELMASGDYEEFLE